MDGYKVNTPARGYDLKLACMLPCDFANMNTPARGYDLKLLSVVTNQAVQTNTPARGYDLKLTGRCNYDSFYQRIPPQGGMT